MKKSTASAFLLVLIILLQEIDQTEGFAAGGGGCVQRGSFGGTSVGRKPARGNSFEVNVGQKKRNGDHWNVKYKNNPGEHSINVEAGGEKSNGDHWSVNYTHDMGGKH